MIKVYIYGIVCPKTKKIMYVGKSKDPHKRLISHFSVSRKENLWHLSPVNLWIRLSEKEDKKPTLIIIEECLEHESKDKEIYWIDKFYNKNNKLLNVSYNYNSKRTNNKIN